MKNLQELSYYIAGKLSDEYSMIGNWSNRFDQFSNVDLLELHKTIENIIIQSADEDILAENKE